jgi:hypothetical protein
MGMPNGFQIELPLNDDGDTVVVGAGPVKAMNDLVQGYDMTLGTGAFTADLEGSVCNKRWTVIAAVADAQGVIPAHYNFVRANATVGGALANAELWYHGKS